MFATIRMTSAALALALPVMAAAQSVGGSMPSSSDMAQDNTRPSVLTQVGIDQKMGTQLPLELPFKDEYGADVKLGQYFTSKRPVLLAFVYYDCPMLCNQVMNGLTSALSVLRFNAGQEFDVVAVSFDPRETPQLALDKKNVYLKRYKRAGAESGWHFLTGSQGSITRLTKAAGFNYLWDEKTNQFAHASAVILITPEGKVAQYYYGIEYSPKDMRLGMIEASQEKIGSAVDQLILFCYHYDPTTGKYGAIAMNFVRLGGLLTLLGLGSFMFVSFRRDARQAT